MNAEMLFFIVLRMTVFSIANFFRGLVFLERRSLDHFVTMTFV